ncbi:ROK family protein [Paenibacillus thiaminolyticus]|uniref:ROK family protein n=1 Tax=Paenibacillus thiaminolyticus TaxID=49283 RepID=A0A3A3H226_PANTH|nr:ROK family protein [Paenibacillus thiaminolyticus]RJG25266.1 ROK family protein [Paenibacillus thiaminolyticus]
MSNAVIGVDIGGTHVRVGLVNEKLELVRKEAALTSSFHNVDELCKAIAQMIETVDPGHETSRIGIVLPVPWNDQTEIILDATNIPYLENVHISSITSYFPKHDVFFENDVNVITLLEAEHGAAKAYDQSIYITVSSGIGSGIIVNNALIHGAHGYAGEIGSMIISDSKRNHSTLYDGTLEALCSGKALEEESKLLYGSQATNCFLFEQYHLKDEQAIAVIDLWIERFSNAIVSLMQTLDPDTFVVGGAVIHHNPWLIERVIESAKMKVLPHLRDNVQIVVSQFGPDAGIIGAGYNVYNKAKGE